MIITKRYAKRLVRQGQATIEGRTNTERWGSDTGTVYVIVIRHDLQRTDHYPE